MTLAVCFRSFVCLMDSSWKLVICLKPNLWLHWVELKNTLVEVSFWLHVILSTLENVILSF